MAFVIANKRGSFEVRESRATPAGPRSRTLATFRELTDDVIEKARERADTPPSAAELRRKALKAGAPVGESPAEEAARDLLREMARGNQPNPKLRALLRDALENVDHSDRARDPEATVSASARSVSEWIGVPAVERARVLEDLLFMADALPVRLRPVEIGFPRLSSA
jgi:hypothetical protein